MYITRGNIGAVFVRPEKLSCSFRLLVGCAQAPDIAMHMDIC